MNRQINPMRMRTMRHNIQSLRSYPFCDNELHLVTTHTPEYLNQEKYPKSNFVN